MSSKYEVTFKTKPGLTLKAIVVHIEADSEVDAEGRAWAVVKVFLKEPMHEMFEPGIVWRLHASKDL